MVLRMKNYLFISCEEAKIISDKLQYKSANKLEILQLYIRKSWCSVTSNYFNKTTKFSEITSKKTTNCLTKEEKENLKKTLKI